MTRRENVMVIGALILFVCVYVLLWVTDCGGGSREKARMMILWSETREKELEAGNGDTLIYLRLLAGDQEAQPWMRHEATSLVDHMALPRSSGTVYTLFPVEAYRHARFDPQRGKFILCLEATASAPAGGSETKPSSGSPAAKPQAVLETHQRNTETEGR